MSTATKRASTRRSVTARSLAELPRNGQLVPFVVEQLDCGHTIAFDVLEGIYRANTVRMCVCCGDGLEVPHMAFRCVVPR